MMRLTRACMLRALVQESGRRGSRGGGLPAKASAPDLDAVAKAAALQARVDEQDIELAALRVRVLFRLWLSLAACRVEAVRLSMAACVPACWVRPLRRLYKE